LGGPGLSKSSASGPLALDPPPTATALTSGHIAVSWSSSGSKLAQVEYSLAPFTGPAPEGTLFPTPVLSPTGYTHVASKTHDLCPADLQPDTLYHVRVRTKPKKGGAISVSAAATVRTLPLPAPVPATEFTAKDWIGLYATDQWMNNGAIRDNLMAAAYARGATIGTAWSDIEPAPGVFSFGTIDQALGDLQAGGKYVKIALRGTSNINGKRIPDWVPDGVETVNTDNNEERSVKWDPVFACRWWQYVTAQGRRYDSTLRGRVGFVGVSGVGSAEMATLKTTINKYRNKGYTDQQIEANVLWAWRNTLQVFAEAFPHARLSVVPGSILLAPQNDVGLAVVQAAVNAYGFRLVLAHSGFALDKHGFLIDTLRLYRDRAWIGGLTELPAPDAPDPVAVLRPLFDEIVYPEGFDFVTLHSDALGINPNLWGDLQALKDYLSSVEAEFARIRAE
jgi:hypothetical protein